ncbi:MAG: phage holin family protein [Pseudomonadota bacterium]|nr:phage holin family protein [Pseudomonadota bacterium]
MANGGVEQDEQPIGELFGRLIDEGKGYAKAEIGLVKAQAEAKADVFKFPLLLFAGAFLFLQAAVVVLCIAIADGLATLIGPFGGGLAATLIALGAAAGLALYAKRLLDAAK